MNRQAAKDLEKADAELNRTYAAVMAKLPDAETKRKLKESQRAWIATRGPKLASSSATTSPSSTPESTSAPAQSVSDTGRTSSSSARSVSPDKQWEYKCDEYYSGTCAPKIVKAGSGEVVLDLGQDLEVHQGEAGDAEVIWAADSKRFAFNYTLVHAHHMRVECVAFYQLRDGEWAALHSPSDEKTEDLQLAQLGKGHLPKDFNPRRTVTF